jgi:Ala-tRNA(Pro) deacylase
MNGNMTQEVVMPILKKLRTLLDEAKISYEVYTHPLAYTAQEIAAKQHFSGKDMAKVVMLEVDDKLVMGVLPGSLKVHVETARATLGAASVRLATEDEFTTRFPECEIGAMPPFGNLFGLEVVVDPALAKDEYIYFNAGNHVQIIRMKYKDFADLVKPHLGQLSRETKKSAA